MRSTQDWMGDWAVKVSSDMLSLYIRMHLGVL